MAVGRSNKSYFSLIELMFVIGILVILIGISGVGVKSIFQKQTDRKIAAEIETLGKAVELYKIRYGSYPANDTSQTPYPLSFGELLSDAKPGSGWTGKREMYIDFRKSGFNVSNNNYDAPNATKTKVLDPYDNSYLYYYDSTKEKFYIWSIGSDGVDSSTDDFRNLGGDNKFGDDLSSENIH